MSNLEFDTIEKLEEATSVNFISEVIETLCEYSFVTTKCHEFKSDIEGSIPWRIIRHNHTFHDRDHLQATVIAIIEFDIDEIGIMQGEVVIENGISNGTVIKRWEIIEFRSALMNKKIESLESWN